VDLFGRHPGDGDALPPTALARDDADVAAGKIEESSQELDERGVRRAFDGRRGEADENNSLALAGDFRFLRSWNDAEVDDGVAQATVP
jgi:hypothetical protein